MDLEQYHIPMTPAEEGMVGKILGTSLLALIAIGEIHKKLASNKSKKDLKHRLANRTPGEIASWNTLITQWNPVIKPVLSKLQSDLKVALDKEGLQNAGYIKYPAVQFPKEQKQLTFSSIFGVAGSFLSRGFTTFIIEYESMTDDDWNSFDIDHISEVIEEVFRKYTKTFEKWSGVLEIDLDFAGDYIAIDVDINRDLVDDFGVLKAGLRNP